jgi:hypothetical protein
MSQTTEPSAKQWLFTMMDSLKQEDFREMAVTMCAIWYARRRLIHDGEHQSPLSTFMFVRRFLDDLAIAPSSTAGAQPRIPSGGVPKWLPPPRGYAKVNVDAATTKTGNGGSASAVCRSDSGVFLGASALAISDIGSPATLEALARREALALVQDLNLNKVCVA